MSKTDDQYLKALAELFTKHFAWNDQQVLDVFKAEHGELSEDDVLRIHNAWIRKRNARRDWESKSSVTSDSILGQ